MPSTADRTGRPASALRTSRPRPTPTAIATDGSSIRSSARVIPRTWSRDTATWDESIGLDWVHPGDLDVISTPVDFLGLNYYTSVAIKAGEEEGEHTGVAAGPQPSAWIHRDGVGGHTRGSHRVSATNPPGVLERPDLHHRERSLLLGRPGEDGSIHDTRRIDYVRAHLAAIETAIDEGIPVDGYFYWSLLDNLEWLAGFSQRFGLVHVDQQTLIRTPKDSFGWYRGRHRSQRAFSDLRRVIRWLRPGGVDKPG